MRKDIPNQYSPDPDEAYNVITGDVPASIKHVPGVTYVPIRDGVRSEDQLEKVIEESPLKEIIGKHHKEGKFVVVKRQAMGVAIYIAENKEAVIGAVGVTVLGIIEAKRIRRKRNDRLIK